MKSRVTYPIASIHIKMEPEETSTCLKNKPRPHSHSDEAHTTKNEARWENFPGQHRQSAKPDIYPDTNN